MFKCQYNILKMFFFFYINWPFWGKKVLFELIPRSTLFILPSILTFLFWPTISFACHNLHIIIWTWKCWKKFFSKGLLRGKPFIRMWRQPNPTDFWFRFVCNVTISPESSETLNSKIISNRLFFPFCVCEGVFPSNAQNCIPFLFTDYFCAISFGQTSPNSDEFVCYTKAELTFLFVVAAMVWFWFSVHRHKLSVCSSDHRSFLLIRYLLWRLRISLYDEWRSKVHLFCSTGPENQQESKCWLSWEVHL